MSVTAPVPAVVVDGDPLFKGKRITVDKLLFFPDRNDAGVCYLYERTKVVDAVAALPVLPDGRVALVRLFRPAVGVFLYEAPAGKIDEGETAVEACIREVREETGCIADVGAAVPVGKFYSTPGICTEALTLYVLPVTEQGEQQLEETEAGMTVKWFTKEELAALLSEGGVADMKTALLITHYLADE